MTAVRRWIGVVVLASGLVSGGLVFAHYRRLYDTTTVEEAIALPDSLRSAERSRLRVVLQRRGLLRHDLVIMQDDGRVLAEGTAFESAQRAGVVRVSLAEVDGVSAIRVVLCRGSQEHAPSHLDLLYTVGEGSLQKAGEEHYIADRHGRHARLIILSLLLAAFGLGLILAEDGKRSRTRRLAGAGISD